MGERLTSETFISRFSDELLKREVFADLLEAKVLVEDYREHCNHHRPHSALGYQTPAEFAVATDLDTKVKDGGKSEELESVLTLRGLGPFACSRMYSVSDQSDQPDGFVSLVLAYYAVESTP